VISLHPTGFSLLPGRSSLTAEPRPPWESSLTSCSFHALRFAASLTRAPSRGLRKTTIILYSPTWTILFFPCFDSYLMDHSFFEKEFSLFPAGVEGRFLPSCDSLYPLQFSSFFRAGLACSGPGGLFFLFPFDGLPNSSATPQSYV